MQDEIGNLIWTLDDDTLTISGAGEMESYNTFGKGKTPWFEQRHSIKKIFIADGVTKIGMSAFKYCANLTEVKIPDTVTEIGDCVFALCTGLREIKIPA